MDPDLLSVGDLRNEICSFGYDVDLIKNIFFLRPNSTLDDGLVEIVNDADIHELIGSIDESCEISIYVDHFGHHLHEVEGELEPNAAQESDSTDSD